MSLSEWKELHRAEKIAWWWNMCSSIARKKCSEGDIDARIFKFENLFGRDRIKDIFVFFGLHWNDEYRQYLSTKKNKTSERQFEFSELDREVKKESTL